ncbi:MAG: trypsin-like peptidase domain-containing protein [Halobacteriovoraceae bacterium]|jgi:V8-like Glu-specific endopeptidase|nr:trypsin-like peptidase domain-containing protein [Halobacteriovoraceae bacterium]
MRLLIGEDRISAETICNYHNVIFPVFNVGQNGNLTNLIGTCFRIADGFFITAAHIFSYFIDINNEKKKLPIHRDKQKTYEFKKMAVGILEPVVTTSGVVTERKHLVEYVIMPQNYDIAFLFSFNSIQENQNSQGVCRIPILNSVKSGERVQAIGYSNKYSSFNFLEKEIDLCLHQVEGRVIDYKESGFQMNPYPCYASCMNILPGHSGAPVLNSDLRFVIGVSSSSCIGENGETSLFTAISDIMDEEFDFPYFKNDKISISEGKSTLRQLTDQGLIISYP